MQQAAPDDEREKTQRQLALFYSQWNSMQQAAPDHERERTQRQVAQSLFRQGRPETAWPFPPFQRPLLRPALCGHGKQRGKCRECRGEDGGEVMGGEASGRGPALRSAPAPASDGSAGSAGVTPELLGNVFSSMPFPPPLPPVPAFPRSDEDAPGDVEEESVLRRRGDTQPLDPPGEFPDWFQQAKHRGT